MSLRGFHILFITACVALALVFAAWCLAQGSGYVLPGIAAVAVALLLGAYETWFVRKSRRLP